MAQALGAVTARCLASVLLLFSASALSARAEDVTRSFLYIEPGQTRFELLVPLRDAAGWMGRDFDVEEMLRPDDHDAWLKAAAAASPRWVKMQVNEEVVPSPGADAMLIDSSTVRTVPYPLPQDKPVALDGVHLALTWTMPNPEVPERILVTLVEVFPRASAFGLEVRFGETSEMLHFTSGSPFIQWTNEGRMPPLPGPLAVPAAPGLVVRQVNVAVWAWVVLGLVVQGILWRKRMRWPGGPLPFLFVWIIGAAMLYPMDVASMKFRKLDLGEGSELTEEAAADILHPLLANVYRILDDKHESKSMIPLADRLADDLLVPNHASLRARVPPANLAVEVEALEMTDAGFTATLSWTVIGVAHHLGHPDQRVNKYDGRVTVEVVAGQWKITSLEIISHRQM